MSEESGEFTESQERGYDVQAGGERDDYDYIDRLHKDEKKKR